MYISHPQGLLSSKLGTTCGKKGKEKRKENGWANGLRRLMGRKGWEGIGEAETDSEKDPRAQGFPFQFWLLEGSSLKS